MAENEKKSGLQKLTKVIKDLALFILAINALVIAIKTLWQNLIK